MRILSLEQNSWIIFPIGMLAFFSDSAQIPVTTNLLWVTEVLSVTQLLIDRFDQGYLNIYLKMKRHRSNEKRI